MCYKAFRHKTTRAILSKKVGSHYRDIPAMKMNR